MRTTFVGPPYQKSDSSDGGRVRAVSTATGAIDILNFQHIAGSVQAVASLQAISPAISIPGTGLFPTAKVDIAANFTLSSIQSAAALPGYAASNIRVNLFVATMSGRIPPQSARRRSLHGEFVVPGFGGYGNHFTGEGISVWLEVEQQRRFAERYVMVASVETWVTVAGWGMAEATVLPASRLDNFTITCLE